MRFAFKDAERLPELLKAIPKEEILRKQRNIRKVWRRYAWKSGSSRLRNARAWPEAVSGLTFREMQHAMTLVLDSTPSLIM